MLNFICKKRKIKVYFICQYIQGCNKIFDVIMAMRNDKIFDVKVLAVPEDIKKFPENRDFEFWYSKFGDITVNSIKNNAWFDLKKEKPNYVFVQRPYDNYLPIEYHVKTIMNFTKICYIPYAFELIDLRDVMTPRNFVKNVSLFFCSHDEEYDYCSNITESINDGCKRKCFNLGYPSLYNVINSQKRCNSAFKKVDKKAGFNVMWTPRWTIDENLSKSYFFEYKDLFVNYMKNHKDINFVFRPHPLIFKNFIEKKLMSKKQVDMYLKNFKNSNMYYDIDSDYYESFADSDVLVSDFSTILIEYIIFNKPIIFCGDIINPTNLMKKMLKCFYRVNNWNELKETLEKIKSGDDYLKTKRENFLKSFLKTYKTDTANKIVSEVKKDFYMKK